MALEWSFSTDRRIRRCQRQFFFGSVAAWHNAKDPLRRESFLLSQVKGMDAWRGNLVHEAIRSFVVPSLEARQAVPWERVIEEVRKLGARQFAFSEKRRFRETGMSKSKAKEEYCALFGHEIWLRADTSGIGSNARFSGTVASELGGARRFSETRWRTELLSS